MLGAVGSMLAPCWLHVTLAPCWLHVGSMLAPCWFHVGHVGSMWPQDGLGLAQGGLMLASCWTQVGVMLAQIGSSWPHVGSSWLKLASCCLKLASCWPQVGLRANFGGKLELLDPEKTCKNHLFVIVFQIASCML